MTRGQVPGVTAVFLLALGLRAWGAWEVWRPDGVRITDPDACQHLRRTLQTIENYPWTPAFDWFSNYPQGEICPWAPLFDFLLATAALAAGLGHPTRALVERIGSCAVPVLGALAVVPVWCVGRRLLAGMRGGPVLAALALAVLPGHVVYSLFGRIDHHVLEALFVALLLAVHLRVCEVERPRRLDGALLGGCLVLLALSWHGFPLYLAVFFAAAHVPLWAARADGARRSALLGMHAEAFAWLFIALVLQAGGSEYYRLGIVAYEGLSSVHLLIVGAATLYFGVLAGMARNWPEKPGREVALWAVLIGLAEAAGATRAFAPQVDGLLAARKFAQVSVNQVNMEGQPLFSVLARWPGVSEPVAAWPGFASALAWVIPLVAVVVVCAGADRGERVRRGVLAVWGVGLWAATVWMSRFTYVFAVPLALMLVAVCDAVAWAVAAARWRRVCAVVFLGALLWSPVRWSLYFVGSSSWWDDDTYDLLVWMREHLPPVTDVAGGPRPEYGVVAPWTIGNHIKYVAGRPVVADNLGYGMANAERLLGEGWDPRSDAPATSRLKYVVTTGEDEQAKANARSLRVGGGPVIGFASHLHCLNGSGALLLTTGPPSLGSYCRAPILGFREVDESASLTPTWMRTVAPKLKVFQAVHGAVLLLPDDSADWGIELPLLPDSGREWTYRNLGRYAIQQTEGNRVRFRCEPPARVPYPTRTRIGHVIIPGPYVVRDDKGTVLTTFDVTEQDVQEGRTVEVKLPAGKGR